MLSIRTLQQEAYILSWFKLFKQLIVVKPSNISFLTSRAIEALLLMASQN
uniref:Uncharacterized protein n=1 Tax=Rhizophora mucronata TaxID=61149 RepID=A0A2P2IU32_RHIMU